MSNTTNVDKILEQRGAIYGSYEAGVKCRADIISALNNVYAGTHKGNNMPETLRIQFTDIALKLMRAASDPTYLDSWVDLVGYTKLIKEVMCDENK